MGSSVGNEGAGALVDNSPVVGTAGVPSADVSTVQGISGATPVAVSSGGTEIILTLSLDTSAYASGDLLADTQEIALAVGSNGGKALLQSIQLLDESNQGVAFTMHFMAAATSFGTENVAPSISAAAMRDAIAIVDIGVGDWRAVGSTCKVANLKNIGAGIKASAGNRSVYVAVVNGSGTPTFAASALQLRMTFLWEA